MIVADDDYADPTVFDQWHAGFKAGAGRFSRRLAPYGWGLTFHLFALACYLALAMIVADFAVAGVTAGAAIGTKSLAATIGAVLALVTGTHFQRAAGVAWPSAREPQPASALAEVRPAVVERRRDLRAREEARVFLEALRQAGVNVTIARALVRAGIRGTGKLKCTSDIQLLAIRGVGPATVARLRRHFG